MGRIRYCASCGARLPRNASLRRRYCDDLGGALHAPVVFELDLRDVLQEAAVAMITLS